MGKLKFTANIFITFFLVLAGYILINERSVLESSAKRQTIISGSSSKLIGQRPGRDLMPFEIQRQRIHNETIYKFQSSDSGESYELEESDLDKFGAQIINFKNVNRDHAKSINMINDSSIKEDLSF